jgi:hypothetical protein
MDVLKYNLENAEFRFARYQTENDEELVKCDFPRTNTSWYVAGYTLYLEVTEHFHGSSSWRGDP